jgi:guanylate kinase
VTIKPKLYMLAACSGSGKSWVCKQLTDLYDYVSYDDNRKKDHLDLLLLPSAKPKLYDPPIKISTFFKRHSDKFEIHAVFILEEDEVVKQRIAMRGGEWTEHISKRNATMRKRFEKYGEFAGTSQEVLDYLKSKV